jgi:hypothetical protein
VFFGTPHRGSGVATYGEILAKIATTVLDKPMSGLISALKRNSVELSKVASDFKFEVNKYKVVSFYERLAMGKGKLATVVGITVRQPIITKRCSTDCRQGFFVATGCGGRFNSSGEGPPRNLQVR